MEETESLESSVKRTRVKVKSTPEKRTEKELRHLGISLKDVPTGGRAKRSSAKYFIHSTTEKEPKDHGEASTSWKAEQGHKDTESKLAVPLQESLVKLELAAAQMKSMAIAVKKDIGNRSVARALEPQSLVRTPLRKAKPLPNRKSPRLSSSTPPTRHKLISKPSMPTITPPKQKVDIVVRRSPRAPPLRCLESKCAESLKEVTPVKTTILSKTSKQPDGSQKSTNHKIVIKPSLKKVSKNLLAALNVEQKVSKQEGTLLKKMSKGKIRITQGKKSKHTGMIIKLKRLQNLRKYPKSCMTKSPRIRDYKKSPERERKEHKKPRSPRKQLKKERQKVKLALEGEKEEPTCTYDQFRRKKLRSEISDQSELWEGFPVDIRMPRLKPLSPYLGSSQSSQASSRKDEMTPEKAPSLEKALTPENAPTPEKALTPDKALTPEKDPSVKNTTEEKAPVKTFTPKTFSPVLARILQSSSSEEDLFVKSPAVCTSPVISSNPGVSYLSHENITSPRDKESWLPTKPFKSSQRQLFAASPSSSSAFENILKSSVKAVTSPHAEQNEMLYLGNPMVSCEKDTQEAVHTDVKEHEEEVYTEAHVHGDAAVNVKNIEENMKGTGDNLKNIEGERIAKAENEDIVETGDEETNDVAMNMRDDGSGDPENTDTAEENEDTYKSLHYDSDTDVDEQTQQASLSTRTENKSNLESIAADSYKNEPEKVKEESNDATETVKASITNEHFSSITDGKGSGSSESFTNKASETTPEKRATERESLRLKIKVLRREAEQTTPKHEKKRKRDLRVTRLKAKTPLKYGLKHDRLFTSLPERSSGRSGRVSLADQELLSDNRMAKHACSLWVSEQRRGFQQQHSDLSSADLDSLMREAWETLTKKEKLRYFNRARIALQDRAQEKTHKEHRTRKSKGHYRVDKSDPKTIEAFLKLPPDAQDRLLKRKMLELEQRLSTGSYQQLLQTFYTNFARSKFCVQQLMKQRGETEDDRIDKLARRLLYIAIMDNEDRLTSADQLKAAALTFQINNKFNKLVQDLTVNDNSSEDCDNVSERLSELLEVITAVQSSEYVPTDVPARCINNIIHGLQLGTEDGLMDFPVAPAETWQVPEMCENDKIDELLKSTDSYWMQLHCQDVDDYFDAIQPATKKFIAVPLNKDNGEAFTIELSETDAEPLLSNMLLNKAEASMSSKEQCCQLDSPSCQMSTLLLADAATQLETNVTRKKRSRGRQRSHIIHAQNSKPFTSKCHGNNNPPCSAASKSHDESPSFTPYPYRPPRPPPQKYVTYQMYPQQHPQQQHPPPQQQHQQQHPQQQLQQQHPPSQQHPHQPQPHQQQSQQQQPQQQQQQQQQQPQQQQQHPQQQQQHPQQQHQRPQQQQQKHQSCPPPPPRLPVRPMQYRPPIRAQSMPWRPPIRQDPRMSNFRPQNAPRMANPMTSMPQQINKIPGMLKTQAQDPNKQQGDDNRIVIQGIIRDVNAAKGNQRNMKPEDLASQGIRRTITTTRVVSAEPQNPIKSLSDMKLEIQNATRVISQGSTKIVGPSMVRTSAAQFISKPSPVFPANIRMANVNLIRAAPPSSNAPRVMYQTIKAPEAHQQGGPCALDLSKPVFPSPPNKPSTSPSTSAPRTIPPTSSLTLNTPDKSTPETAKSPEKTDQ